jgi:ElaB/YqjD/DUF883 family membrane-anchored ribosome-binding protein
MAENLTQGPKAQDEEIKQAQAELNNIKSDLSHLQKDIRELMHALKGTGESRWAEARSRAQGMAHDRAEQMRDQLHEFQDRARRNIQHAREVAQERPFSAVFGALTVGVFLGLLLGARRK